MINGTKENLDIIGLFTTQVLPKGTSSIPISAR